MAKIARQNFKVFGLTGDTADFAKFGSQEAAAPIKTKDIELIQSLEAWDKGWADAIVDANKAPYMEDMNAAMYVFGYQLGYVLQEGIPEWDDGTTYYAESIVKKTTTQELYASKTNDNVGNALPNKVDNTDWKYLVDLDSTRTFLSPTGSIVMHGGATAPTGWLLCQGQAVSESTYAALFAVIAYTFGNPGGGNFNLPNLQDKFPIGKSGTKALGSTGGANTKDLEHTHDTTVPVAGWGATGGATGSLVTDVEGQTIAKPTSDRILTSGNGGSTTQDVLNAYQALNYIIKI